MEKWKKTGGSVLPRFGWKAQLQISQATKTTSVYRTLKTNLKTIYVCGHFDM